MTAHAQKCSRTPVLDFRDNSRGNVAHLSLESPNQSGEHVVKSIYTLDCTTCSPLRSFSLFLIIDQSFPFPGRIQAGSDRFHLFDNINRYRRETPGCITN